MIDPMIEPMPPITTTANTTMITFSPISGRTWVFGGAAQIGAESRPLDQVPGPEADDQREDHHPAAIDRKVHEAEIHAALQFVGDRIRQSGRTEVILEHALDDQRQPE